MKRWVVAMAAIFAMSVMVSGIAGCGAELPTTSEYDQGGSEDTKAVVNLEIVEDEDVNVLAD